jgi:uncharacterized protein
MANRHKLFMSDTQTKISVKVQPNAGKNEVVGLVNGVWKIKIAAPPDKGKANNELIELLSDLLGQRKDTISIIRGQTSHNKLVTIGGLTAPEIESRLSARSGK